VIWATELKSSIFWKNDLNLIRICVELLHTLSVWLTDARYPHYFINNCNLLITDSYFDVEMVISQLKSIDQAWLSTWFVNNYIRECSKFCPDNVSSLFSDVSQQTKLQNVVSAIVDWRINTALKDILDVLFSAEFRIAYVLSDNKITVRSCMYLMTELLKTYTHLTNYFTALVFLHVMYKISKSGFTDKLMDVLATIAGQSLSPRHNPSQCSSKLSLSKATKLMKVVANSSPSTMQRIEIELSKAYLYEALRCKDSASNSVYCLANVYLAVLYYNSGQYQMVSDHCKLVTRLQDHSQCSSHVVQGEFLPKIDDDVDNLLGLAVLYQYVRRAALNQRQTQYVSVFTTELFAHYLNIRCLAVTHLCNEFHQLRNFFCRIQIYVTDVLVLKLWIQNFHCQSITAHCSQQPARSTTELETSELAELLQRSAVEHLTTYRQLESRDFASVATIVTTDFDALYKYKSCIYQQCLDLSIQNVHILLNADMLSGVFIYSAFVQLLDDDIVSLIALTLIVNSKCRDRSVNVFVSQMTLLLYLMTQSQLNCATQ